MKHSAGRLTLALMIGLAATAAMLSLVASAAGSGSSNLYSSVHLPSANRSSLSTSSDFSRRHTFALHVEDIFCSQSYWFACYSQAMAAPWPIKQGLTALVTTWSTDVDARSLTETSDLARGPEVMSANQTAGDGPSQLDLNRIDQNTYVSIETGNDHLGCGTWSDPCAHIAYGIDQADAGGIVHVAQGTYTENLVLEKTVHLSGGYSKDWLTRTLAAYSTTVDGGKNGAVLTIDGDLTPLVEGFTFINGHRGGAGGGVRLVGGAAPTLRFNWILSNVADLSGGGIYVGPYGTQAPMIINNTVMSNTSDSSEGGGGGIYVKDRPALIQGNLVQGNRAVNNHGGGLYLSGNTIIQVLDNHIIDNEAANYGGGVYIKDSPTMIQDNVIASNHAMTNGGGIYLTGITRAHVISNQLLSNTASSAGAGAYIYSDAVPIFRSNQILNNTATKSGGGIYIGGSGTLSPTIISNTIAGNTSHSQEGGGGGIYVTGRPVLVQSNMISSNRAALNSGGGIYLTGGTTARVLGNHILDNEANNDGGGALIRLSSAFLANNTVVGNRVDDIDGALYATGSSPHLLQTTTITRSGGGLFLQDSDATVINGNTVASNTSYDDGGGLYLSNSAAVLSENDITSNTARLSGGGLFLWASDATLNGNSVVSNTATWSNGGGLFLSSSDSALNGNTIISNTAVDGGGVLIYQSTAAFTQSGYSGVVAYNTARDNGGGVYIAEGRATLSGGQIISNTATSRGGGFFIDEGSVTLDGGLIVSNNSAGDEGGGVYAITTTVTIRDSQLLSNTAWQGGGLYLNNSADARLIGNTIRNNNGENLGGGFYFRNSPDAELISNTISHNVADHIGGGQKHFGGGRFDHSDNAILINNEISNNCAADLCGGVCLDASDNALLMGNVIVGNTAGSPGFGSGAAGGGMRLNNCISATLISNTVANNSTFGHGGGLFVGYSDATLTNNIIADNQITVAGDFTGSGSGLYVKDSSLQLLNTTIARNTGGDGSGVYVSTDGSDYSTVALTNTILVSHSTGITVTAGNSTTLEATLWGTATWSNSVDWGGAGIIITGAISIWDDPAFVDAEAGDYHIGPDSAAIDAGVDVGVDTDIDGMARPQGARYDIGADEWGECTIRLPLILRNSPPASELYPIHNTDGNDNYDVRWSTVAGAKEYVLEEAMYGDSNNWTIVYTGTHTYYTVTDRGPTRYYYRVKARDGWPDGVWSNVQWVDVLWEGEPNDRCTEANGPLISGKAYYGYHNDLWDFFKIDVGTFGLFKIELSNHTGQGVQLHLWDHNCDRLDYDSVWPYYIERTGVGRYYVSIFTASGHHSNQAYTLRATLP